MKSITQTVKEWNSISQTISKFMKKFYLGSLLNSCNANKSKGYRPFQVFEYLISLIFGDRSMYMSYLTDNHAPIFKKDTVYRFLNNPGIHWQKLTALLSAKIIKEDLVPLTSEDRKQVFIIDDTLYERARSKQVELLSRVYDHVEHRYAKGFRLLTLGWSDGNSFVPVVGSLLASEEDKNVLSPANKGFDKRTLASKRRAQARRKATQVMLELLDTAIKAGIDAQYVLFDTWFCSPSSLLALRLKGLHAIAMVKKTPKAYYLFQGKPQSVMSIFRSQKKRRGRSKYLLSVEAEAQKDGKTIPVKFVFIRNRNNKKDYLVLVSTDTTLSENEIIQLYGRRWSIEVFFKTTKSYLSLGKLSKGLSYDAQTAHVAITFSAYMLLALEHRHQVDERSLGELFYLCCDEMDDITFQESLNLILEAMIASVETVLGLSKNQVSSLVEHFVGILPESLQNRLKIAVL